MSFITKLLTKWTGGYSIEDGEWIKGNDTQTIITIHPPLETASFNTGSGGDPVSVQHYIGIKGADLDYFEIRDITFDVLPNGVIVPPTDRGISVYGIHLDNVRDFLLHAVQISTGTYFMTYISNVDFERKQFRILQCCRHLLELK